MTEEQSTPAAEAVTIPEQEITFKGRQIWVKMPTPEQLLVWKRTIRSLQDVQDATDWTGEQVMRALERTRLIIDSVLANNVDKEWLDDEMLAGTLGLMETAAIINQTVAAFADAAEGEGNRETKRAAKKTTAKKAVRKAAPRPAR